MIDVMLSYLRSPFVGYVLAAMGPMCVVVGLVLIQRQKRRAEQQLLDLSFQFRLLPKSIQLLTLVRLTRHKKASPPRFAEWLIALTLRDHSMRQGILGDKEAEFRENVRTRGFLWAYTLYWGDALLSAGPLLWSAIKKSSWITLFIEIKKRVIG